jgi:hypothetical protein
VEFREIKDVFKQELLPREEEIDKIEFELKYNESKSAKEEYPHTPVLKRSVQERRKP